RPSSLLPYTTLFRSVVPLRPNAGRELRAAGADRHRAGDSPSPLDVEPGHALLALDREGSESEGARSHPAVERWISGGDAADEFRDRKSTRLNSSHEW